MDTKFTRQKKYILGNWKNYLSYSQAIDFCHLFLHATAITHVDTTDLYIGLAIPDVLLHTLTTLTQNDKIPVFLGSQDISPFGYGAYTGATCGGLLKDLGSSFVILGHSERAQHFGETRGLVAKKIPLALKEGLLPIICVGEYREGLGSIVREKELRDQLNPIFYALQNLSSSAFVLAYEPVWAIQKQVPPSAPYIQESIQMIREICNKNFQDRSGQEVSILYGGAVSPQNISELLKADEIDGFLVGKKSTDPSPFLEIIKYFSDYLV